MNKDKTSPSPSQRHSERREYHIGDPGFEHEYAQPKQDKNPSQPGNTQNRMSDVGSNDYENDMLFGRSGLNA